MKFILINVNKLLSKIKKKKKDEMLNDKYHG